MLIYAAYLLIWPLTVSPILTVLIYHFRMDGGLGDAELLGSAPDGGLVLYDVKRQLAGALLDVPFHTCTTPMHSYCMKRYMR